jgi:hypothetical protein
MEAIILLLFLSFFLGFSVWYFMRNSQVFNFRTDINDMSYWYSVRHDSVDGWDLFYDNMPSYEKMFWSFKPLKISSYFDEETIERLFS